MHISLILFVASVLKAAAGSTPDIKDFFPEIAGDLTRISWGHAINSENLLKDALTSSSPVMMLEADVSKGRVVTDGSSNRTLPIMAHPPFITSDLSLASWIDQVIKANEEGLKKGAKLDFKNLDIVLPSLEILKKRSGLINFPLWLNADILHGPGRGYTGPVDAEIFLSLCTEFFPDATLSLGWTTAYIKEQQLSYTQEMIDKMIEVIEKGNVHQPVTFPIRAAFVSKSLDVLKNLMKSRPQDTITIWTSETDDVDLEGLASLQSLIGKDKVYFDIPESLMKLVRKIESQTVEAKSFAQRRWPICSLTVGFPVYCTIIARNFVINL